MSLRPPGPIAPLALTVLGLITCACLSACNVGGQREPKVAVDSLERSLEAATDIQLNEEPDESTPFSLSSLASARSGVEGGETILLLEFFSDEATSKAVGRVPALGRTTVIRDRNVVLLYTRRPGSPDHEAVIRRTLRDAPAPG